MGGSLQMSECVYECACGNNHPTHSWTVRLAHVQQGEVCDVTIEELLI